MAEITFDASGRATFPTKYHGEVTFSKRKWDEVCGEPERFYYRFNGEKVATTLVNPDYVRHHKHNANQFLFYKAYPQFVIAQSVTVHTGTNFPAYFAVVIDISTNRVCTVYPVFKPKTGKEYHGA